MSTHMAAPYPVRVSADLDPSLNRWLWLVKWAMAIPHVLVLALLWPCFVVLSVVAFFAILFTGRYPRVIFDFNVGVLRWSWRVTYFAYGTLGTDRYPPFTLAEVPDYPAHLEIGYPEHLSRGLVLVKWWLLALPHYLVTGFFLGGSAWAVDRTANFSWDPSSGGGLIGLLVLIAAVTLLVTGRYPRPLFDLVLGLNRWVLRVAAYAALMTDSYPPFRLDMGPDEPGGRLLLAGVRAPATPATTGPGETSQPTQPAQPAQPPETWVEREAAPTPSAPSAGPGAPAAPATPAAPTSRWSAGRVVALILGVLAVLLGGGMLAAGTTVAVAGPAARDTQGYYMTPHGSFDSAGSAVVSTPFTVATTAATDWVPARLLGRFKMSAHAPGGGPVFLGIGRTSDVRSYLDGVTYTTVTDLGWPHRGVTNPGAPGRLPATRPAAAGIWVAQRSGTGEQVLTWPTRSGSWTLVAMRPSGAAPVRVDAAVGFTFPAAGRFVAAMLIAGGVLLALGIVAMVLALRSATVRTPGRQS